MMSPEDRLIHSLHDHRNTCARTARKIGDARDRLAITLEALACERPGAAKSYTEAALDILDRLRDDLHTERLNIGKDDV